MLPVRVAPLPDAGSVDRVPFALFGEAIDEFLAKVFAEHRPGGACAAATEQLSSRRT
jgi:hypothetical protein